MSNKRNLKKYIDRISTLVVEHVLPEAVILRQISDEEACQLVGRMSEIHGQAIDHINFDYPAPAKDADMRQYKKERSAAMRKAYRRILEEYTTGVNEILAKVRGKKA